jgi:hypothetical protein
MSEICCVKEENGDILLSPCKLLNEMGPGGIKLTTVKLSRNGDAFSWFINFLEGKENIPNECPINGRKYRAYRESTGNVFLEDIRDGGFISVVGFSAEEIPNILAKLTKRT